MMSKKTKRALIHLLSMMLLAGGLVTPAPAQDKIMADAVLDREIHDRKGNLVGEVDELIIRRSGKVKKVTIEVGGFLGFGDKLVALPFSRLSLKDEKAVVDAAGKQLEKRRAFDYYEEDLRPSYYFRPGPFNAPYRNPRSGYIYRPYRGRPPAEPYQWAYSPSRFLASIALDRAVINDRGERIGWIEDLIIDRTDNKVSKIILSEVEIDGKRVRVALPYKSLGFTAYGLVYDIRTDELDDYIFTGNR